MVQVNVKKWFDTKEALEHTMYRRLVGKIIFCIVKIFPEGANAARELA
jgi:predicted secreted protein